MMVDKCHTNFRSHYLVPEVHNFVCRQAVATPGRDPDYKNPGLRIFVHSGIGFYPERKVRVAYCI
jgi:hypothetical protein